MTEELDITEIQSTSISRDPSVGWDGTAVAPQVRCIFLIPSPPALKDAGLLAYITP